MVQYAYDIMDRVTNISWRTTSGATFGGFSYEYDAVGRITSRSHALGDPSQPSSPMPQSSQKIYAYDDLDRLASDGDVAYTYDAAGNRMTRTENGEMITYTLGVGDRLASWTGGAYTHDAAGNVTRIERVGRPTLDLTWNSQYQLAPIAAAAAIIAANAPQIIEGIVHFSKGLINTATDFILKGGHTKMPDQVRVMGIKKVMRGANEIKNEVDAGKKVVTEAFRYLVAAKMTTTLVVAIQIKRI